MQLKLNAMKYLPCCLSLSAALPLFLSLSLSCFLCCLLAGTLCQCQRVAARLRACQQFDRHSSTSGKGLLRPGPPPSPLPTFPTLPPSPRGTASAQRLSQRACRILNHCEVPSRSRSCHSLLQLCLVRIIDFLQLATCNCRLAFRCCCPLHPFVVILMSKDCTWSWIVELWKCCNCCNCCNCCWCNLPLRVCHFTLDTSHACGPSVPRVRLALHCGKVALATQQPTPDGERMSTMMQLPHPHLAAWVCPSDELSPSSFDEHEKIFSGSTAISIAMPTKTKWKPFAILCKYFDIGTNLLTKA